MAIILTNEEIVKCMSALSRLSIKKNFHSKNETFQKIFVIGLGYDRLADEQWQDAILSTVISSTDNIDCSH